jgi:uncharacterized membrane protein YhaH (DUF805 family)
MTPSLPWRALLFSRDGRIGRADFWRAEVLLIAVGITTGFVASFVQRTAGKALRDSGIALPDRELTILATVLLLLVPYYFAVTKRLADLRRPASLVWVLLVVKAFQIELIVTSARGKFWPLLTDPAFWIATAILAWFLYELGARPGNDPPQDRPTMSPVASSPM